MAEIAALRLEVAELRTEAAELRAEAAELRAENVDLKKRLDRYEGPKTPQNSSLPPSTQHPHAARRRKASSKRKRGGEPSHRKYERPLIPTEECDVTEVLKPRKCRRCGTGLSGVDPAPLRHQVWEFPKIRPHITEYQRHRLKCPCCSRTTSAALPAGVPTGKAGPRLVAFTALLMASFRQSKRRISLFLGDLLGQQCSPALTVKIQNEVSSSLEHPYQELRDALPSGDRVFMDESPTKQEGKRAWLWAVVTPLYAVYSIFMSRAGTAVDTLLGSEFGGFVNCDRAKMEWRVENLQWCWSHLKRDFQP